MQCTLPPCPVLSCSATSCSSADEECVAEGDCCAGNPLLTCKRQFQDDPTGLCGSVRMSRLRSHVPCHTARAKCHETLGLLARSPADPCLWPCLTRAFVLAVLQCIDDGWYGCIEDSQCCTAGFFCNDGYCQ